MAEIEQNRVDVMPDRERVGSEIPRAIGFLLTRLFSRGSALLHAECPRAEADVAWYIRLRTKQSEGEDELIATFPAGIFSSIVARLALVFEIDYTTGGCGRGTVLFEGRCFECHVFLSKCAASGYWIRVYAAAA